MSWATDGDGGTLIGTLGDVAGTGVAADVRSVVCGLTAYATAAPPASPSRPHNSATRSPRTLMRHTVSTARLPLRNHTGCDASAARLRTAVTGGIVAG